MKLGRRCTLCGGRLDSSHRCTECGLDNTKNDSMYKNMISRNACENKPLTHVHEESQNKYDYSKYVNKAKTTANTVRKSTTNSKKKFSIVGIVFGVIMLMSTIVPAVATLIDGFSYGMHEEVLPEDFFVPEDYFTPEENYQQEYWLAPGFHEVGVHIPAGWCEIGLESGEWVDFKIYSLSDDGMTLEEREAWQLYAGERGGVYLEEGDFLMIEMVDDLLYTSVWLYTDSSDFTWTMTPEIADTYIISGENVIGEEIPAGVYDIMYAPKSTDESGSIYLEIQNPNEDNPMLETSLYFECYDSSFIFAEDNFYGYYVNVPLTPGSILNVDEGLGTIYLCPSFETSEATYDITWGAN